MYVKVLSAVPGMEHDLNIHLINEWDQWANREIEGQMDR
jgi:hypothetical protein